MELEMKYGIADKDVAESIWTDEYLMTIEEENTREKVFMKAAYFDTDEFILSKNDITFRVRMENDRISATIKWSGKSEGAMHQREEINVPIVDEACFISPQPSIFKESQIGLEVIDLIGNKGLESIIETKFLRSRFRVDTGNTIIEVSIDKGEIITEKGIEPILEMELEMFSGNREDLIKMGEEISQKYGLNPEEKSKYARGKNMLLGEKFD
jgi:inorganic triphosphatase YgiF